MNPRLAEYPATDRNDAVEGVETNGNYQTLVRHAALGATIPGMSDALGMLAFYQYLDEIGFRPFAWLGRLWSRATSLKTLASGEIPPMATVETIRTIPSADPESIPVDALPELFREVRRYQWLEAEKAGRNIWAERSPEDPDGLALRDWMSRHYATWRRRATRQAA